MRIYIMDRKVQILEGGQEDKTSMIWVLQNYKSVPRKCLGLKGQHLIIISDLITWEAIKSKNLMSFFFGSTLWDLSSQPRMEPGPQQWKCWVLTTRQPVFRIPKN